MAVALPAGGFVAFHDGRPGLPQVGDTTETRLAK